MGNPVQSAAQPSAGDLQSPSPPSPAVTGAGNLAMNREAAKRAGLGLRAGGAGEFVLPALNPDPNPALFIGTTAHGSWSLVSAARGPQPLSRRALLGGLLLAAGSALAQPTAPEHEIKANLLARLSQHLEWPASVFATPNQPIVIGLLGESPTSAEFEETLRAFKPAGRPLQIRRLRRVEEARDCQLLYLHRSEDGKLKTLLATLKDQPVFTTGDHADFLKLGGVLRFWRKRDSLAFHISEAALRASKITANPRLLQLSDDPAKPH